MKTRMEKVGRYLKERTREWLENGFRGENGVDALNCAMGCIYGTGVEPRS